MADSGTRGSSHLPGIVLPRDKDLGQTSAEGVTPLMIASYNGDVREVKNILQRDTNTLQMKNQYNLTALDYAIDNDQVQVVDVLLGYGADLDLINQDGLSVLHRCVLTEQLSKVETCIQIGVNLDLRSSEGETALHLAIQNQSVDIVFLLIKHSCDITARNKEGFTPMEWAFFSDNFNMQQALTLPTNVNVAANFQFLQACATGDIAVIETMVAQYGDAIVHLTEEGASCLHVACQYSQLGAVITLCKHGANVNQISKNGDTALIMAAITDCSQIVSVLAKAGARMNYRNILGRTALHCAVIEQNVTTVKVLVENGALINVLSTNGSSPLYIAAEKNNSEIAKYLIDQSAVVDSINDVCLTPLIKAVLVGNVEIICYLIENGANIEKVDLMHHTPLMVAVQKSQLSVVKCLVEYGADIQHCTPEGPTITELALFYGKPDIHKYLSEVINQSNHREKSEQEPHQLISTETVTLQSDIFELIQGGSGTREDLNTLIKIGVNINAMNYNGKTPLITAISSLSENFVEWLIQEQVDVNQTDNTGCPPLIHAVLVDSLPVTQLILQSIDRYQAATQTGASVESSTQLLKIDQSDREGKTALCHCVESDQRHADQIAAMLIQYGADIKVLDNDQQTILEKYILQNKTELVHLLLQSGAELEPLCPGVLTDLCLHSDTELIVLAIKHLKTSNSKRFGLYMNVLLNFAAASINHTCMQTCISELSGFFKQISSKGRLLEMVTGEHLVPMAESFPSEVLTGSGWDEHGNTLLAIAASTGMVEFVRFLLQKGTDAQLKNNHGQDALHCSLQCGHYEVAAELSTSTLLVLDKTDTLENAAGNDSEKSITACGLRKCTDKIKLLWMETLELVYRRAISKLISNPESFISCISKENKDAILRVYVSPSTDDKFMEYVRHIPFIDMYRIERISTPETAQLLTSKNNKETFETNSIFHRMYELVDICGEKSSKFVMVSELCGCLVSLFRHQSSGCLWAVTTADAISITAANCPVDDDQFGGQNCKNVQKIYYHKACFGIKSANFAAVPLADIDVLKKSEFLLTDYVFSGKESTLLTRRVRKIGQNKENTEGEIIDVNVSFQDQLGHFHHGAFVVSGCHNCKPPAATYASSSTKPKCFCLETEPFAQTGDSGAVVIDKTSGIVIGLVVASYQHYVQPNNHVTFYLRMDYALRYFSEKYNLNFGRFRVFEE